MRRIIDICWRLCKQVPLLPITILSAIPLALLGEWKPWGEAAWDSWISQVGVDGLSAFNPGVGQWIVIALVAYTIVVTVRGMIDDLRHGHVGVDLLAVVAIASTVAVQEYWAAWAVVLMISSGEAIEEFAQSKAESNLTALIDAAPRTAHVVVLPGMRGHVHASGSEHTADVTADGFRTVRVSDSGETDNQDGEKRAFASESPETDTKGASQTYDAAGERFETVPVDQVQLGDVILVLPGETVPVDGELLSGVATLDLSNINGEPVPREVYAGARVMSGAVNGSTTLTMRATQLAHDSQYQKILELVSSAQESRPAVVKTADMLAVPFTVLSLAIAGIAWAISGLPLRFAQVLVLATPRCDKYLMIEDFYPTILEMAGVQNYRTVQPLDGTSFMPLLKGTGDPSKGRAIVWNFPNIWGNNGPGINLNCSIRKDEWKLVYYYETGKKELFNIPEDIGEKHDVAAQHPDIVKRLSKELGTYLRNVGGQRPGFKATNKPCPWPDEV